MVFLFAIFVACAADTLLAVQLLPCPIPLEKGTRWTYEGKVETAFSNSPNIYSTNLCWTMEVIDSRKSTNAEAAVVRGFVDELPWYEPAQVPGFCVLLCFSNRVYQYKVPGERQATLIMQEFILDPGKFSAKAQDFNEFFSLPLARDKRWGGDTKREDGCYCWRVEEVKQEALSIQGVASNSIATVYEMAYRSLPDHQLVNVVPGLGITRYVFAHHGTIATVNVRLVSFQHSQ